MILLFRFSVCSIEIGHCSYGSEVAHFFASSACSAHWIPAHSQGSKRCAMRQSWHPCCRTDSRPLRLMERSLAITSCWSFDIISCKERKSKRTEKYFIKCWVLRVLTIEMLCMDWYWHRIALAGWEVDWIFHKPMILSQCLKSCAGYRSTPPTLSYTST